MNIDHDKRFIYILVCFGCLVISFNVAAIAALVPAISQDLNLPDFLVAKIIPYYLIPYGIGALIYAPLTRFLSYRWVYITTMLLYSLSCYVCATAGQLEALLIGRTGMGITAASAIPLGLMLIGEFFNKEVRGRLVGVFFSCAFIASIAGLMVAGVMDWPWIFYIPAVLGVIVSVSAAAVPSGLLGRKHAGHINYFRALKQGPVAKVFIYIFAVSFLYHGVHKWYGVYLNKVYGFDKFNISAFFILTVFGGMCGQLWGGVLSDKKGRFFTCMLGIIGLSLTVCLLKGFYPKIFLGMILFFISAFWTIGHNGISTVLTDFACEDRPVIASLNSSVRFISGGLGFYVSSFFVEKSFSVTFFAIGVMMLGLSFFVARVVPKLN